MSYYQFNRQEILQKAKERYSKKKPAEYDSKKQRNNQRNVKESINFLDEEKDMIKEYQTTNISATDSVQKRNVTK